jgi:hypothetical protein
MVIMAMLKMTSRRFRVRPVRAARHGMNVELYEHMVRERSPYTGILEAPRGGAPRSTSRTRSTLGDFDPSYYEMRPRIPITRTHLIALAALALVCGGITLVSLSGEGTAMAAAASRSDEVRVDKAEPVVAANGPAASPELQVASALPVKEETPKPTPVASAPDPKSTVDEPTVEEKPALAPYEEMIEQAQKASSKKRITLLRDAIEAYPNEDEALAMLSLLLMESAKTRDEALELASRAADLNADNATAWLTIGYISQLKGQTTEARAAYGKCAKGQGPRRIVRDCRSLI